ncbi:MAG TPA: hypothetical protein VHC47_12700, partial [Mucilaginibacter sp.]|nr:hypothetical protein [Mucilaginibacter sp.]
MQGKGVVKFFAIFLALVCLYQLSFTWVVKKVQDDAKAYAKGDTTKERAYLDSIATEPVYPIFGHTYQYCENHELALGLDLQGGMSVTMQVSLRQLVKTLSNNNPDPLFNQALDKADADAITSQSDYITLFVNEYEKLDPNGKLATIFSTKDNQDHIKYDATNSEVEAFLKDQANVAVQQTYTVLNTRIDQFGVTQPNIQLLNSKNEILIELPGVKEPDRIRKLLQGTAKLEFYKTYDNTEAFPILYNINNLLAAKLKAAAKDSTKTKPQPVAKKDTGKQSGLALLNKVNKSAAKDTSGLAGRTIQNPLFSILTPSYGSYNGQQGPYPGPIVGHALSRDTAKIDAYLRSPDVKASIPQNIKFLWGVKPMAKTKMYELYAMKLSGADNGPVLQGDVVTDARSEVDPTKGGWEVEMTMNSQGAEKWKQITAEAAPKHDAIAIVLDDNVYSAPGVDNEISGGVSSISGNFTQEDTQDLANVLKAGRLPARAVIVDEATVGASLGQQAIKDSLLSSVIGFLVVLVFMIAYYNRAGTVAVVAVLINV